MEQNNDLKRKQNFFCPPSNTRVVAALVPRASDLEEEEGEEPVEIRSMCHPSASSCPSFLTVRLYPLLRLNKLRSVHLLLHRATPLPTMFEVAGCERCHV